MKSLRILLLVLFALIVISNCIPVPSFVPNQASSYFALEANAEAGALAEAEPEPFHKKNIISDATIGRVIILRKRIESRLKPHKKISSKNHEKIHEHGRKCGKTHGHGRKNCGDPYPPGKIPALTTIAPTVTSGATVSPSNSTGTTKSNNGNPGSTNGNPGSTDASNGFSEADTSSTEVNAISTGADSVSTGINMGSTQTGTGSTQIGAGSAQTGAGSTNITIGPTGANTESTVSEISSTQANTESTAATTTVSPGLTLEEILSIKTPVCIRNVQAGILYTTNTTANGDRRFTYVSNEIVPADTPESRWTLEPGEDGGNRTIFIKSTRKEYFYPSTFGKETFKFANSKSFVNCTSESEFPPGGICLNYGTYPFTWIPGSKDSDEIFEIIPASNNEMKLMSVYYPNHYIYAFDGDVTTLVAGADAPDKNMLWIFERCDFPVLN